MEKHSYFNDPSCGDQFAVWEIDEKIILCIVDGLGHGPHAEVAGKAAIAYVGNHLTESITDIFKGCDEALRSTRGVAMGVAVIDENTNTLTYAGIGNTEIRIINNSSKGLASDYGVVGGGYRSLKPQTIPFKRDATVILFTDGIDNRLDVSGYGTSLISDPQELAKTLVKDWGRETDDRAVIIYTPGISNERIEGS